MLLILLISLFLFIIYLYYLPLELVVKYHYRDQKSNFQLELYIILEMGFTRIRLPLFNRTIQRLLQGTVQKYEDKLFKLFKLQLQPGSITGGLRFVEFLRCKLTTGQLNKIGQKLKPTSGQIRWNTEYGLADPALTGILYGILWSIKSTIISFLQGINLLQTSRIKIRPDFEVQGLEIDFNGIFSFYLGNSIYIVLLLLKEVIIDGRVD